MKLTSIVFGVVVLASLTSCTQRTTQYSTAISAEQSQNWRVADVQIIVPDTLTTTEQNSYAPDADIVWHGDSIRNGTRQEQVGAILKSGIADGASGLNGSTPVILVATLAQFHGITPRARQSIGGVHNVDFQISVIDARTGQVLTPPVHIQADEYALAGDEARAAVAAGQTQGVRIRNRIRLVVASWLGISTEGEQVILGGVTHVGR